MLFNNRGFGDSRGVDSLLGVGLHETVGEVVFTDNGLRKQRGSNAAGGATRCSQRWSQQRLPTEDWTPAELRGKRIFA